MKYIVFILIGGLLITSCSSSKEASSSKAERKNIEKEQVIHAVEARQYVIRLDKIISQTGTAFLVPENNFFIMNGEIASVSLAYMGRSFYIRPISGINFNGQTVSYEMQKNTEKGSYDIQVKVEANGNRFDFYLSIGTSGNCSISVTNPNIQSVSYYGTLIPLEKASYSEPQSKDKI
jgi:hypothetical protein